MKKIYINFKDINTNSRKFLSFMSEFATIAEAVEEIKAGRFVIVMDSPDRENEGDLVMAAEFATPKALAFAINHTTGILCAPMTGRRAAQLGLHLMVPGGGNDPKQTAFTQSVDSVETGTGVSAEDRAKTFVQLADPKRKAEHFRRPGHIFPLIAKEGGVLERQGHTEAAVELCQMAGMGESVGLIGELMNSDGTMKRLADCLEFARLHNLCIITVELIRQKREKNFIHFPLKTENLKNQSFLVVKEAAECILPIQKNGRDLGIWRLKSFMDANQHIHVALIYGEIGNENEQQKNPTLVRVHSECFTGDVLGSQRCDCRQQLGLAMEKIFNKGNGILLYNNGHEGRGIGLGNKIRAYAAQQRNGLDTFAANTFLGFSEDMRSYEIAKEILRQLGVYRVHLLTGNKTKIAAFQEMLAFAEPIECPMNEHNREYLVAKKTKNSLENGIFVLKFPPMIGNGKAKNNSAEFNSNGLAQKSMPLDLPVPTNSQKLKIGIVKTNWNAQIVHPFTAKIRKYLTDDFKMPEENIEELLVPGSFETPWAAKMLSERGKFDAIICVGVLLKGETAHFDVISNAVAKGFMDLQLTSGIPIINAIFNCLSIEQAIERCNPGNPLAKSLALTTIHMAELKYAN